MNAALFMLTSAWMAGADGAVPPAPATVSSTPAVISTGSSCGGGCSTACDDPCASKPGFFSRFKGKFGHKSCDTCATAAPAVSYHPAPVAAPSCNTCSDPCASKPGLFSRLKSFGHKSSCGGCDTGCGTSTSACAGATTTVPGSHPEVIPAPKKEKEMPKGGTTGITVDPVVTPVATPRGFDLNGQKNPY